MPARSRIDERAPSAATSSRASIVLPLVARSIFRSGAGDAGIPSPSCTVILWLATAKALTAAGSSTTPSSFAFAASAASSGPFSTMWANGSPGSTSPSKVRNAGRTAS